MSLLSLKARIMLLSSSSCESGEYLNYGMLSDAFSHFLENCARMLFFPFALEKAQRKEHTSQTRKVFEQFGVEVVDAQETSNLEEEIREANCFFVGGGNTYQLLAELIECDAIPLLRQRVDEGITFIGSSAGSVVAGSSVASSMSENIVGLENTEAICLLPFMISPHFPDKSTEEYQERKQLLQSLSGTVYCPPEGTWCECQNGSVTHHGEKPAELWVPGQTVHTVAPGSEFGQFLSVRVLYIQ